jgi:hypothetical protein
MPLKLSVGVSRKVGLPDYGSVGAMCSIELELDGALLERDPEALHARVRHAYVAARRAVQDELARQNTSPTHVSDDDECAARPAARRRDGARAATGNGHRSEPPGSNGSSTRRKAATPKQVAAIVTLARRNGADLEGLLHADYGVGGPEQLTLTQASRLIDALKAVGGA